MESFDTKTAGTHLHTGFKISVPPNLIAFVFMSINPHKIAKSQKYRRAISYLKNCKYLS